MLWITLILLSVVCTMISLAVLSVGAQADRQEEELRFLREQEKN